MEEDFKDLYEYFLKNKLITKQQLEIALTEQRKTKKSFIRVLVDLNILAADQVANFLASKLGVPFIKLSTAKIDIAAIATLPPDKARQYSVFPFKFDNSRLCIAMVDPTNIVVIDDIRSISGYEIVPYLATKESILAAIQSYYRFDSEAKQVVESAAIGIEGEDELKIEDIREAVDQAPIVKLVNMLVTQAVSDRASDIHVEPHEKDVRIRFRIDGVLHEVMRPPKRIQAGLISRLKIISEMNIAERRIPQDGRASFIISGKKIDIRVASLPTIWGEKIVLRILEKGSIIQQLNELGFESDVLVRYESSYMKPYGTILVTGPTGSGKSTTLYATLNILNNADKNIITVEDPVEYQLPGINQIQTNVKAGLTFASGLRSILRSDPDIVMIGEIRDLETAKIAIESALTGHLVLSTIHTNDAPSATTRLIDMGVEPFLVSSAIDCVLAQRLVRKLCPKCKRSYNPTEESLKANRFPPEMISNYTFYGAVGCGECNDTGYRGRLALFEVMPITEEVRRLIVERRTSDDIKRIAIEQGMITLRNDGLRKVINGITSIEEVMRVVV
ncbi:MAG: Flp pilus assembly complex ATPase component TadA [Actinobacteria bacterium]|nr:Flp pilus assembly complex ATPase component TadA [Actinomycetota bacterium]